MAKRPVLYFPFHSPLACPLANLLAVHLVEVAHKTIGEPKPMQFFPRPFKAHYAEHIAAQLTAWMLADPELNVPKFNDAMRKAQNKTRAYIRANPLGRPVVIFRNKNQEN